MSDTTSTQALTSSDTLADETAAEPKEAAVIVDHVKMSFNMANEQLNSLKEYFIKALRHELFFKEFIALNDVSFTVYKGDVYGIVGTNGSGKSTILKIIAGVLDPTTGTCTVNGSIAPLIELGAGFDLELTARENIYLNGALLGYSHDYIDEHFDEIVEFAELEEFLDLPMKNYSSGMVARIAFAIATIIVPDILIVDEALAVGDVFFQQKCERRINSLISDHGTTVLFVSHSIEQVERICQKAIWIEKGRKLMEGSVGEVCLAYRNMEYIDYTNVHGIMPAEEDQSQDPYEELTYVDLARAFWNCVSVSSSEEEQTAPFLFGWMLRSIAPPEAVDLIGDDPNGLARRDAAAVLVHSFALHRRPTAGEYEPTALGPYADAGNAAPCTVEALTWAVDHHLMAGVKDEQGRNIIRPDKPISRIQFAKMLTIMFREQLGYPEDISPGESFVRSGSYDYAINHSLMGGYASGQFGPHDVTTRGQALTVLWRAAGEPVPTSIPAFNDVHEGDYFASAVAWAIEQGLMEKTGDSFKPDDMIRRSDFLSILSKYEQLQGIQNLDEEIEAALAEDVIDTRDLMQRFGAAWDPNEGVSRALLAHAARLIHSNQMERESQSNTQDSLTS